MPRCHTLRWPSALAWLAATLVAAGGLGWLAARVQQTYAPLVLFPLLSGVLCGGLGVWLSRVLNVGHRVFLVCGTVLAALVTVGGLHWHSYAVGQSAAQAAYDAKAGQFSSQLSDLGMLPPPPPRDFAAYLDEQVAAGRKLGWGLELKGASVWWSWGAEGLLTLLAAAGVSWLFSGQPFCDGCQSWYRGVRQGTLPGDAAARVRGWCELPAEPQLDYRCLACQSGCGPTGLEVSWKPASTAAGSVPGGVRQIWLSAEQRHELLTLLDRKG